VSATSPVLLVARREFLERARDRSFQMSTAITTLILLGVIVIPHLLAGGPPSYKLGMIGPRAQAVGDAVRAAAPTAGVKVALQAVPDRAAAEAAVRHDRLRAVVTDRDVVVRRDLPAQLAALLQAATRQVGTVEALRGSGADPASVQRALATPPLPVSALSPQSKAAEARKTLAFFGIIVLYGQLVTYGLWVATGVVEEKSSRVVEVLLAAIRPRQLLTGKLLGIGLLGLLQLLALGAVGLAVAVGIGAFDLPAGAAGTLTQVLLWFLLGYVFYATIFAGAAATVSRQEEMQNAITPLTLVILASFFFGFSAINNPSSTLATVTSYLPPVSVMVMPSRWAGGDVSAWQLLVAVALMLLAILASTALAVRLYEGAVLRVGAKVRLRDAWHSARTARSAKAPGTVG